MAAATPSEAKTTIDSLAELLKANGKMELGKISQTLGIDAAVIENWAKVLEQGNLAKITYEVGKMYVAPVTLSREQEITVRANVEAQRGALEIEVATQRASIDKFAATLDELSLSVKSAERIFQQRLPDLERELEGINKIYNALENENLRIDQIKKTAEASYGGFNKRLAELYSKIESVDADTLQKSHENLGKIEGAIKKAGELDSTLHLIQKSKEKSLDAIRKSTEDQLTALKTEVYKAEQDINSQMRVYNEEIARNLKQINEQANAIKELTHQINAFRREKENAKKVLSETKINFNDEYAKIYDRMERSESSLRDSIKAMLTELNTLKSSFGEASKIYDSLQRVKMDVDDLSKSLTAYKETANSIIDEMRTLDNLGKVSTEERAKTLKKLVDKSKELKSNVSNMKGKMETAAKKLDDANRGEN